MSEQPINIDKINPPAIVEKAPAVSGSMKAKQDILAQLNGLKVEIPESIAEQERKAKEFIRKGIIESGGTVTEPLDVKFISKGVFAVRGENKDVSFFADEKGELIVNIKYLRKNPFVEDGDVFKLLGYVEKLEDGEHRLYKKDSDKFISQDSIEFVNIWKEIDFNTDILLKIYCIKNKIEFGRNFIINLLQGGTLKFEDLELIKKKGLILPEDYDFGMEGIRKYLVSQCKDKRLIDFQIGIKESDIKKYLEKGFITPELALECYKVLPVEMKDLSVNSK